VHKLLRLCALWREHSCPRRPYLHSEVYESPLVLSAVSSSLGGSSSLSVLMSIYFHQCSAQSDMASPQRALGFSPRGAPEAAVTACTFPLKCMILAESAQGDRKGDLGGRPKPMRARKSLSFSPNQSLPSPLVFQHLSSFLYLWYRASRKGGWGAQTCRTSQKAGAVSALEQDAGRRHSMKCPLLGTQIVRRKGAEKPMSSLLIQRCTSTHCL